jgi:hypothetical protein
MEDRMCTCIPGRPGAYCSIHSGTDPWEILKQIGSEHYKTGQIEPIDLYRSSGMLRHFALGSIIKYAFRNSDLSKSINLKDLEKVKHYADMLIVDCQEGKI